MNPGWHALLRAALGVLGSGGPSPVGHGTSGEELEQERRELERAELERRTIDLRLNAAAEAARRARLAFFVSIIVSLAMLIAIFNGHFAWDRRLAYENAWARGVPGLHAMRLADQTPASSGEGRGAERADAQAADSGPRDRGGEPTLGPAAEYHRQALREWVRSTMISVPLLGIVVSASDLSVLGALSLFIISLWLYFASRRANRTIGFLLRDTQDKLAELRTLVFHGVVEHLVFVDVGHGDMPVEDLDSAVDRSVRLPLVRSAVTALFYLPAAVVALLVVSDLLSLIVSSTVAIQSAGSRPIVEALGGVATIAEVAVREIIAIVFGVATAVLCHGVRRFEAATGKVLRHYNDKLEARA